MVVGFPHKEEVGAQILLTLSPSGSINKEKIEKIVNNLLSNRWIFILMTYGECSLFECILCMKCIKNWNAIIMDSVVRNLSQMKTMPGHVLNVDITD